MSISIRRVYLYLTSLVGMVLILVGAVELINLGLRTWVFTKADTFPYACSQVPVPMDTQGKPIQNNEADCLKRESQQRSSNRQSTAAQAVALIIVGTPVYLYHWNKIKNEKEGSN